MRVIEAHRLVLGTDIPGYSSLVPGVLTIHLWIGGAMRAIEAPRLVLGSNIPDCSLPGVLINSSEDRRGYEGYRRLVLGTIIPGYFSLLPGVLIIHLKIGGAMRAIEASRLVLGSNIPGCSSLLPGVLITHMRIGGH